MVKKKKKGRPNGNLTDSDSDTETLNNLTMVVKTEKATEGLQGNGPTTPLPDKNLLVFILERLQKKDTYGVFSEPVDPDELPDYFEVIEHPMDFGTVRRKLDEGGYSNLDNFEADVLLICTNGMQYNAPDTVYFRQAKSMQDIAKRDFQNLRQPEPKIVKRGRPPNSKKALSSPPIERVGPESSSDVTLATAGDNNNSSFNIDNNKNDVKIEDNAIGSNSRNLRKGLASFRSQSTDAIFKASPQSCNIETYADHTTDWNSEFPDYIVRADAKHAKKHFLPDENRRTTYKHFHPSAVGQEASLSTLNGNMKQLIGVGLQSEHGYARSLARFAANLGPVIWKVASKKIERALPSGVNFGPGWVGKKDTLPSNSFIHVNSSHFEAGLSSCGALAGQMPYDKQSLLRNSTSKMEPQHLLDNRNGVSHLSGYDFGTQAETLRAWLNLPTRQQSSSQEGRSQPDLALQL